MSEERKTTLRKAIQVKNRRKTMSTETKLDVTSRLVKGERIVDICLMLDSLIVAYVVIMLTELQKVLSQELKGCVARLPQSCRNEPYQKLWRFLNFSCITNK